MKFKRFLVMICVCSLCICMTANVKARADAFPSASEILTILPSVELTGITNAYEGLSPDQKLIANYIIGAYNNAYLCARGFKYNIPSNETSLKAQFLAMGELVFQYATTAYGWRSRFNEVFRQYLSSAVVYASEQNNTFDSWYSSIQQNGSRLFIPYSAEAFDAWTVWYDDPSGDGIASLGETVSDWVSGVFQDFAFVGLPWANSNYSQQYNDFILNNNPVIYSTPVVGSSFTNQVCIAASNFLPDSVFVLRNSNNIFQFARYGFSDFHVLNNEITLSNFVIMKMNSNGTLYKNTYQVRTRSNIIDYGSGTNISTLLSYVFNLTPYNHMDQGYNYYPYIQHVYLVDDLNSLSNPEEVFNVENLHIIAPTTVRENYIISPNGKFLLPMYTPLGTGNIDDLWEDIVSNSYDIDTQLNTTDDDYSTQIVNNTTINNYYVTDNDKINVPVEWFENDLTDQLAQDSIPFLQFARDCIDCLGDLQIYLYGAVVFGLAGGVLKKFLL